MTDPLEEAAATYRQDAPRISDAMKNWCSVLAGSQLTAAPSQSGETAKKVHSMEHLLACAKTVLRLINAHALACPHEWAEEHPQGADESALDRVTALTNYKACFLLAEQIKATPGAKVTKLTGRSFLKTTGLWITVRQVAAKELASLRFPPHTVEAFLSGWGDAIDGTGEQDKSSLEALSPLVWAADFGAELKARQQARLEEVRERRERMETGEDEAQRLREAMLAGPDVEDGEEEADEPRIVETTND